MIWDCSSWSFPYLHICEADRQGTSWGSQPRRLPCRAALRWSAAFCWHLGCTVINCGSKDRMGRSYHWFMFASYWFRTMVPNNIPYEYVLAIASGSQRFFYWSLLYPIVGHFWCSDSVRSPFCCWFHAGHSLMLVISYHRVEWDKGFRSVGG